MRESTTTFSDVDPMTILTPAPLGIGLYGYGGAGKTESALRLAFGIKRVYGGEVYFVDTENRKGLAYRALFPFRYVEFRPPHSSERYIELLRAYANKPGVLVIDQFTEEHDGEGGMLETKEAAMYDRSGEYKESRTAVAWNTAKQPHKRLARELRKALSTIPIVGTWRAEDKTDWNHKNDRGKIEPVPVGQMPIGSKDLPFEMTAHYLLRPGARGVPCLKPETRGEDIMTKIPRWFAGLVREGKTLNEDVGEAMARWAQGAAADPVVQMQRAFDGAQTLDEVTSVAKAWGERYPKGSKGRPAFADAYKAAEERVKARPPTEPPAALDPEDFPR